jgi:hypothetical protein
VVKFDIPPKENFTKQVIASIVVLVIVAVVVAILSRLIIGVVTFLLGAVFGVGSQVVGSGPLDKE